MEKPQSWTPGEGEGQQESPENRIDKPIRELGREEEDDLRKTLERLREGAANDNEETSEEDLAA